MKIENLIPIGKTNKPKVIRTIAMIVVIGLIVALVFVCYSGLKYETVGKEKYCYIPFALLLFNIPIIIYIVKICKQSPEFIFYSREENKIYLRRNKVGIYKGFYIFDVENINAIYSIEQYVNGSKLIVLRIEFKNGHIFVSNDYFNYDSVILNLLEFLPEENKSIVKKRHYM